MRSAPTVPRPTAPAKWTFDITQFPEDGMRRQRKAEWHFG